MRKHYTSRAMEMVRMALKSRADAPSTPRPSKKFRSEGIVTNVPFTMDINSNDATEPVEVSEAEEMFGHRNDSR